MTHGRPPVFALRFVAWLLFVVRAIYLGGRSRA